MCPIVAVSKEEFLLARSSLFESRGGSVGFVPTMGALHEGHLALVREARANNSIVVVSVFVNPLQFEQSSDLSRYPKTFNEDLKLLSSVGVDIVFFPKVEEMYGGGSAEISFVAGRVGGILEGEIRGSHFSGMLMVVAKLFNIVFPDRAYFGEKDAQQLYLVRRMVYDLDFLVEVISVPIVREVSGLALSSRNRFLSGDDVGESVLLSRALSLLADFREERGGGGVVWRDVVLRDGFLVNWAASCRLLDVVDVEYFVVVRFSDFTVLSLEDVVDYLASGGCVFILVAARVGSVRLLDNVCVSSLRMV